MKQCFEMREYVVANFIDCVKGTGQTCVNSKDGPQVPFIDLNRLVGSGEKRLMAQAQSFMKTMGSGQSKAVVQVTLGEKFDNIILCTKIAVDLGTCMKNCFLQKNTRSSCFDKTG